MKEWAEEDEEGGVERSKAWRWCWWWLGMLSVRVFEIWKERVASLT